MDWHMFPHGESYDFGDPWLFLQRHHETDICVFEWNVWTTTGWIVMKFVSDIHVPLRMNCKLNCFSSSSIIGSAFECVQRFGLWPYICTVYFVFSAD